MKHPLDKTVDGPISVRDISVASVQSENMFVLLSVIGGHERQIYFEY